MHTVDTSVMCKWTRPFWGTDCRRWDKSLSSAQAASVCSASILGELESACRVSILCDALTVRTVCFSGALRGSPGRQQQFAIQTLRVHLLGLDYISPSYVLGLWSAEAPTKTPKSWKWQVTQQWLSRHQAKWLAKDRKMAQIWLFGSIQGPRSHFGVIFGPLRGHFAQGGKVT